MNAHNCHCTHENQGHLNGLAGQHRKGWQNALAGLVSPLVRLHQFRNVRTRMLHEALRKLDHCKSRDRHA